MNIKQQLTYMLYVSWRQKIKYLLLELYFILKVCVYFVCILWYKNSYFYEK